MDKTSKWTPWTYVTNVRDSGHPLYTGPDGETVIALSIRSVDLVVENSNLLYTEHVRVGVHLWPLSYVLPLGWFGNGLPKIGDLLIVCGNAKPVRVVGPDDFQQVYTPLPR